MEYLRKLLGQKDPNAAQEFFADDPTMVQDMEEGTDGYQQRPTEQASSELFERNVDRAINDAYAGGDVSPEVEAEATRRSQEMADQVDAERLALESQQSPPSRSPAAQPPKSREEMLLEEFQKLRKGSDEELKSARNLDMVSSVFNVINPMLENRRRAKAIQSAQSIGADPGSLNMPKLATDNASRAMSERQSKINELIQEQKLMAALRPKSMSKLDEAKIRESEAKAKMFQAKTEQAGKQPTSVFEKKKMENLATAGVDYITKDRDQLTSNVDKINSALDLMKKAPSGPVSGAARGLAPDVVRSFTNPEAITTKEYMQSAIQETLRPTLGAQFTETEGKKIMELAYNEKADPTTNMKKATALKNMIEKKVEFSDALYKHLEENGTDKGFPYEKYGMRKASGVDQGAQKNTAKVGDKTFQVGQTVTIKGKQYIVKDAKGNLEELK
jgi:hypothetical protein